MDASFVCCGFVVPNVINGAEVTQKICVGLPPWRSYMPFSSPRRKGRPIGFVFSILDSFEVESRV